MRRERPVRFMEDDQTAPVLLKGEFRIRSERFGVGSQRLQKGLHFDAHLLVFCQSWHSIPSSVRFFPLHNAMLFGERSVPRLVAPGKCAPFRTPLARISWLGET